MTHKLALICFDAFGHVNPTLPMTAELVRRGAEVSYFVPPNFAQMVAATGAQVKPYDSIFVKTALTELKATPEEMMATFPLRLLAEAEHVLPDFLEQLKADRPDVVLYDDMCFAGRFAATILKIPAVAICTSYAKNEHFSLLKNGPQLPATHPARLELAERAARLSAAYAIPLAAFPALMSQTEVLNLVFMPRAYQPMHETFDERFAFVGPQIAPRATASVPLPVGDEPLLLVSLGTVFNEWPEFFQMVVQAFTGKPWRVVMAIGEKIDASLFTAVPANITVARYVPQLDILPQAAAFITHGGMNSVQEAISFGVPMVVLPQVMEQAASAERVAELGLGQAFLDLTQVTPEALYAAVSAITIEPRYRSEVVKFSENSKASGGYLKAVELIWELASRAQAR